MWLIEISCLSRQYVDALTVTSLPQGFDSPGTGSLPPSSSFKCDGRIIHLRSKDLDFAMLGVQIGL